LLQHALGARFHVALAMRYGQPSIAAGLETLRAHGAARVIVLPAFPQYSRTTTGTVKLEVERVLARGGPALAVDAIDAWYDDAGYVDALAERCRAAPGSTTIDHWVWSFHGLPERYVRNGDPYREQCERTAELLAARLALPRERWTLAYQSRFGREPWLQPYVDELVPSLARQHARIGIAMPGFTADCIETLEEIGMRLRASFHAAGGRELVVVPCLNDSPALITALARLVRST
jgi:ferrochelatase